MQMQTLNKEMDKKRKDGLKALKEKLNKINQDENLHAQARLEKLYDETEIIEFIQDLML